MRFIVKYTKQGGKIHGAKTFDLDDDYVNDKVREVAKQQAGTGSTITEVLPNDNSETGEWESTKQQSGGSSNP